jgi:hypothetical protein
LEFTSQFVNKVPEVEEANQMSSLQTGLWISLWTLQQGSKHLWLKFCEMDCNNLQF